MDETSGDFQEVISVDIPTSLMIIANSSHSSVTGLQGYRPRWPTIHFQIKDLHGKRGKVQRGIYARARQNAESVSGSEKGRKSGY